MDSISSTPLFLSLSLRAFSGITTFSLLIAISYLGVSRTSFEI
jgi:hypothetical protein